MLILMKRNPWLVLVIGALLIPMPMWAHHAGNNYDRDHPVTVTGTVTAFEFVNPHVRVQVELKDADGNLVEWTAESGPPQRLFRSGWNGKSLKAGDQITVTGWPAKDGNKSMSIRKLVAPSGQTLTEGAE